MKNQEKFDNLSKLGAKKYRKIEAMQKIKKLKNYPGWKPKINFVKELSNIIKNL